MTTKSFYSKCPTCGAEESAVIDSRPGMLGTRRRRVCVNEHRFSTVEVGLDEYESLLSREVALQALLRRRDETERQIAEALK